MKLPEAIIIDGKECLDILCCKILIWEANSDVIEINDPDENKCLVIRECESIEINDTYKKLINSASVRFPRGTVIKRTITSENIEKERCNYCLYRAFNRRYSCRKAKRIFDSPAD